VEAALAEEPERGRDDLLARPLLLAFAQSHDGLHRLGF
jgi:hypothetical protein